MKNFISTKYELSYFIASQAALAWWWKTKREKHIFLNLNVKCEAWKRQSTKFILKFSVKLLISGRTLLHKVEYFKAGCFLLFIGFWVCEDRSSSNCLNDRIWHKLGRKISFLNMNFGQVYIVLFDRNMLRLV